MKKSFILFIVTVMVFTQSAVVSSAQEHPEIFDSMTCESAVLMEQKSGKIIAEKNMDKKSAPASITKIMTMLLIMEELENGNISLNDMVRTSANAKIMGGSEIFLAEGEEMSLNDILKGIAIASANDAAVAAAEFMCGTEQAFVDRMNERAAELKLENTHYMNCHGLDEDNHYTCARDVAVLTRELMKHDKIREYTTIWMDSLRNGATELVNTNRLIRFYNGATGLKTGTTENAGHCLSATASRDGLDLIAVVMNCKTGKDRFSEAASALDYGFANYANIPLPSEVSKKFMIPVLGGKSDYASGRAECGKYIFAEKNKKNLFSAETEIAENVTAPVEKGQILGRMKILCDGEIMAVYPIVSDFRIDRKNFLEGFVSMWEKYVKLR